MERRHVIRQLLSLALALALVLAPCAIIGVASFQALASTSAHAALSDRANGPDSAHGDCHDPLQPGQDGCATDCHSWNLAPTTIKLQATDRGSDASPATDQSRSQASAGDGLRQERGRGIVRLSFRPQLQASRAPVYALTERYRI